MNTKAIDFSDLDDFDAELAKHANKRDTSTDIIPCVACAGSGTRVYGYVNISEYKCGICRGTGKVTVKRLRNIESAKKREAARRSNVENRRREFNKNHAEVAEYLFHNYAKNDFLGSLWDQLGRKGTLSEKQIAAVKNSIERIKEAKEERLANAPEMGRGVNKMMEVFNNAIQNGIKRPKVRTDGFIFSRAPDHGQNAGYIYVKNDDHEYLGKIGPDSKFIGYKTPEETLNRLEEVCKNPLGSAVAYGRKTGNCSCCGRELTDSNSIEAGIGPICASKYF